MKSALSLDTNERIDILLTSIKDTYGEVPNLYADLEKIKEMFANHFIIAYCAYKMWMIKISSLCAKTAHRQLPSTKC